MNTKELIEKIEALTAYSARTRPWIDKEMVLEIVKQLDELQKPVVPQFVANWYEEHKDDLEFHIWDYILDWYEQEESEFKVWMNYSRNKPIKTLINMKQFGYKVEKEKRYLVKAKGMDADFVVLKLDKIRDSWYLGNDTEYSYTKVKHTRKELEEAGFDWVFDCPGIEIEEVK